MPLPVASSPAVERFLEKLEGLKGGAGDKWTALCPAHDDSRQSLSIKAGTDGRVLVRCHAGCTVAAIALAVGMTVSEFFADSPNGQPPGVHPHGYSVEKARRSSKPEELGEVVKRYDYLDASGELLYQTWRYEPKNFRPWRLDASGKWVMGLGDIQPVLYYLPDVIEAVSMNRRVFLVEGEKDADALIEAGYPATTVSGGASNWKPRHADVLAGAEVVIIPDNDEPGRSYAAQAAADITSKNGSVRIVTLPNLPPKGDLSDWLEAGGDFDQLEELIERTATWRPTDSFQSQRKTRWRLKELLQDAAIMRPPPPVVPYLAWASRSTLLAAREKSGKSTLTGWMATQVSFGADFLGEPCQRGRTLIIGLEEYIGDTARRLKEFGADDDMIDIVDSFNRSPSERIDEIRGHIDDVKPVLVIIDSLIAFSQGIVTDANNATQTQATVQAMTNLAHQQGVALIIIHHAKKADGKYRDSSAIGGSVDIIAEVFPPEECEKTDPNRRRVRPIGRVPARTVDFRFTGSGYELVDGNGPQKTPLDQRIAEVIRERPGINATDVADAVGERRQEVLNRIAVLISKQLILNDGTSRGMRLRLPSFAPAAAFL